jgi:hypothetical protein
VFLAVFICTIQTILAARSTLLAISTKKAQIQSVFGIFWFALSLLMRNCWLDFERELLLAAGRKKQMTSAYVSFKRLLGILRRMLEKFNCNFSPQNCSQMP